MRTRACLIALLVAAACPTAATAAPDHGHKRGAGQDHGHEPGAATGTVDTHEITAQGLRFSPARLAALAGDTVTWRNADAAVHDVSAQGGTVHSGTLSRGQTFSHRFEHVGGYAYRCTLHAFMTGQVDVHAALLSEPAGPVLGGAAVELHGRVPAGSGPVTLEQRPPGAGGFSALATVAPAADGTFAAGVAPPATTDYRVVAPAGASPPVTLRVAARLSVKLAVVAGRRFTRVRVRATGGSGLRAALQLYSRERFSWREVGRARLDRSGRAGFRLRAGLRYHARVVITQGKAGAVLGSSRSVKLPRR